MAATGVGGNGSPVAHEDSTGSFCIAEISTPSYRLSCSTLPASSRLGEVKRVTKETNVHVKINLDGTGVADCSTGIPFLDHMLDVSI
jgi:imidazoleglycerol-phosphate dehydratase